MSSFIPDDRASSSVPLPNPISDGWTTVSGKQGSRASCSLSSLNPEKGKANFKKTVGPKMSANQTRPLPSNKAKTWYDPDDHDLEIGTRGERTVKIQFPPGVKTIRRSSFVDQVGGVVGLHALEACGPSSAPHIWLLTFRSQDDRDEFVKAGNFITREGHEARVEGKSMPTKTWIKVHWVPYNVPMASALRQLDVTEGVKTIAASYDKVTGLGGLQNVRSLLRNVLVEVHDLTKVPYSIKWNHEGMSGVALVTMKGRPPVCLKCNMQGHVRKECTTQKCAVCMQWGHNNPSCTKRPGYSAVVGGAPFFEEAAELLAEDMEGEGKVTPPSQQQVATPVAPDLHELTPLSQTSVDVTTDGNVPIIEKVGAVVLSPVKSGDGGMSQGDSCSGSRADRGEDSNVSAAGESHPVDIAELFGSLVSSDSETGQTDNERGELPTLSSQFLKSPQMTPPKKLTNKRKNRRWNSPSSHNNAGEAKKPALRFKRK